MNTFIMGLNTHITSLVVFTISEDKHDCLYIHASLLRELCTSYIANVELDNIMRMNGSSILVKWLM